MEEVTLTTVTPSKRQRTTRVNKIETPKYTKLDITQEFIDTMVAWVKKQRGRILTAEEKYDILLLQAKLRLRQKIRKQKNGPGRKSEAQDITKEVAELLNRKAALVGEIWREYILQQDVVIAQPRTGVQRTSRIPHTRKIASMVQEFVRVRRMSHTRTVAKDVLSLLEEKEVVYIDRTRGNKDYFAALRSVQRYLLHLGYKQGKKKGSLNYHLKGHIQALRDVYVMKMINTNGRRVVYMDESYIHQNYSRHEDSLYDPNDEQDLMVKQQHKGRRYCFIAAIIDADQSIPHDQRTSVQEAQLMEETLDIFVGGKQTIDYHGMFNHTYFVTWMRKLLNALRTRGIQNAIIVMDNAKYHKQKPSDTPRRFQGKNVLRASCDRYGIDYISTDTKNVLWCKLSKFIECHIDPVICTMAKEEGHEVLFSPPHYSDLQPIELVWAIVKGEVGRQYSTDINFTILLERLQAAFTHLTSHQVQGCINKANECLRRLYEYTLVEDSLAESSDEDVEQDEQSEYSDSSE